MTRHLTLHFDGACEPRNPGGVATGGWIVEAEGGEILHEGSAVFCEGFGATNNVAEYAALEAGLTWLSGQDSLGPAALLIQGDSQLVISQVDGSWKCHKPHLERARDRCLELLHDLRHLRINSTLEWVPRESNEIADALSREAYEKHTGRSFPTRKRTATR